MKKLTVALLFTMLFGCYDGTHIDQNVRLGMVNQYYFRESGMRYILFRSDDSRSGIVIINLTKDSLEVELMKKSTVYGE